MKRNHPITKFETTIIFPLVVLIASMHLGAVHAASVVAWGCDCEHFGQTNVPPGLTNAVTVEMGGYFALALTSDGRVVAWGDSSWNPDGETTVPPGLTNVVAISAGY